MDTRTKLATRLADLMLLVGLLLIISATNILKAQQQQQQQQREFNWLLAPTESCRQIRIVRRQEWGAKRSLERLESFESSSSSSSSSVEADGGGGGGGGGGTRTTTPYRVFVHQAWDGRSCADIDSCSIRLQAIQAYHQHSKGWPDISYNFLISADGTVYEGLGFTEIGFHTLDYNHNSLGVAFIGTFQDIYPTQQMERALQDLLDCAVDSNYLTPSYMLHGHRDARCTICPGNAAYERISRMPHFRPGPLARYTCPNGRTIGSEQQSIDALASMMVMQNSQPQQQVPAAVQVLNINSNNQMVAAAVAKDTAQRPASQPFQEEETIVGVFQRKRAPQQRESHSEKSLFKDDIERDDGDGRLVVDTKASISKGSKEALILVNVQQPDQHQNQQPQPMFYLLTTKSVSKTTPILLLSQPNHLSGSHSHRGGSNTEGGGRRGEGEGEGEGESGSEGGNRGDGNQRRGPSGEEGGRGEGGGGGGGERGAERGGERGGQIGGQRGSNNRNPEGEESGGGRMEPQAQAAASMEPISLLDKLFDLDLVSNITSRFF